jgi:hypothetical protein
MGQCRRAALAALLAGLAVPSLAFAQPATNAESDATKPDAAKAGSAKPAAIQPDIAKADAARPATMKAEETFNAGHQLLKSGNFADACPKFEESQRADPASGTLLALAYCQELSGLLASACSNYRAAADLAAKEGQTERQQVAAARAEALSKRVSTLTVEVPVELTRQPGLVIKRDGIVLDRTAYNVAIPLNGGTHAIEVSAPGYARWAAAVTLQNEADHKTLALPILERENVTFIPLTADRRDAQPRPAARLPAAAEANTIRVMRQASLAMGVGSAVAVGFGITFGIAAKSRNDASNRDNHCDATGCDVYGRERRSAALDAATISTWSFVTAGALGAGALVLYFGAESKSAHLATSVVDGSPRVSLSGSF